jgi:hypothetical protein
MNTPGSGSGQAPDGTTISITSSAGGSDANIGGTSSSGLVTILSNTFEASGTVSSGSDTTITASADIAPASIQSGGVLTIACDDLTTTGNFSANGAISITAQGNVTIGNVWSSSDEVDIITQQGTGSGQWQSNGNVSCQGPIYANAGSSITILENVTTLANGETSAPMSIASGGPITIFSNTTFSAYGEIDIYSGGTLSKTNPYPAYLPANVSASQVTSTSGTVYWGDSLAGLQVNPAGTTTFTVNGYDLVFYADGNTIQIGYSATFTTLTVS